MVPLKVTLNGFLSYREKQTIDFSTSPLWMLSGDNGAGKSSIFDAILFALFGRNRDEKNQDFAEMINWHCDRFSVGCEFEVGTDRYLAERTVEKTGKDNTRTTRRLRRGNSAGTWDEIPGSTSDDGFKKHIDEIFGKDYYTTFTSSVLLRQGKTDRLLDVGPVDRFTLLSQIVGLSQYKDLHQKAADWQKDFKGKADALQTVVNNIPCITDEEIAEMEAAAETSKTAEDAAQQELTNLTQWAVQAAQWEKWVAEAKTLTRNIEQAQNRIAGAEQVRKDKERHDALRDVLPYLKTLREACTKHKTAQSEYEGADKQAALLLPVLEARHGAAPALKRAAALEWHAARLGNAIQQAEEAQRALPHLQRIARKRDEAAKAESEIEDLQQEPALINWLPAKFDHQQETSDLEKAQIAFEAASNALASAVSALRGVTERIDRFAAASTGEGVAACLYCNQPLKPEQVRGQSARLDEEKNECERSVATAQAEKAGCTARLTEAKKRLEQAQAVGENIRKAHDKATSDIKIKESIVSAAQKDAADASRTLFPNDTTSQAQYWPNGFLPQVEQIEQTEKDAAVLTDLRKQKNTVDNALNLLTRRADALRTGRDAQIKAEEPLAETWRDWYYAAPSVSEPVTELEKEFAALANAPKRLGELEAALRDCDEWQKRLESIHTEIEGLPEQARREAKIVQAEKDTAQKAVDAAREAHRNSQNAVEHMKKQKEEREATLQKRDAHRREEGNYQTLAGLLGRENLQRVLLRDAEDEIVRHANEALRNFSQGTLYLSARPSKEARGGKDEALDLLCSNTQSGGAEGPLPLSNLSGSQKFRVAVALALGIGHFASGSGGKAARSESVIIDEGFGSLDRQNQQDMADAIRSLADGNYLKRVIVVSHQEAFAAGFPDRIHIGLRPEGSRPIDTTST